MELTQELLEKILDKYVECRYCKAKNIECSCFVLDETKLHKIMKELEKESEK